MALKLKAIPIPDLRGKTVLDVGCDNGYWCFRSAAECASLVLGIDRGRVIDGVFVDLTEKNISEAQARELYNIHFRKANVGKQWADFGKFDIVFCFSMYHHVFQNCGDHHAIWYWLWRHTGQELLWENPTGVDDDVVRLNVSRQGYNRKAITEAAYSYFDVEHIGPGHVRTREVWRCKPKPKADIHWRGKLTSGGGGATKAFKYAEDRRCNEIADALGFRPFPGSLNVKLDHPFCWGRDYFRAELLDPVERANLDGNWKPRWCRFYPVTVDGQKAFAMRFEGEEYAETYIELIAGRKLRDVVGAERVTLCA